MSYFSTCRVRPTRLRITYVHLFRSYRRRCRRRRRCPDNARIDVNSVVRVCAHEMGKERSHQHNCVRSTRRRRATSDDAVLGAQVFKLIELTENNPLHPTQHNTHTYNTEPEPIHNTSQDVHTHIHNNNVRTSLVRNTYTHKKTTERARKIIRLCAAGCWQTHGPNL